MGVDDGSKKEVAPLCVCAKNGELDLIEIVDGLQRFSSIRNDKTGTLLSGNGFINC